ncbi:WAT1-related protein At5g64700-like [Lolium perenne]|uniref:WAT1-related protein At5g64700-like n=1 Tax=Lolium perenne TaxID=4522 RepID=UPI0021E9F722|nr:WAT1-related protein At5g64700-like [Lolium perenne]
MDASKKPYTVAVIIQLIYTGMFVVSKAAFNQGMNTYVFIFYRQAAGSILLLPLALLHQRKNAQSALSFTLLLKLFFCALIGITFSLNLYHVSLKFTSATVAAATDNSLPAVTFFLALLLRMEVVHLKSPSGIAKLTGVAFCIAGVLTIAIYAGPLLNPLSHSHGQLAPGAPSRAQGGAWIKWTFLMVVANAAWSLWIVLQAALLREYPNKLLVTAVQCVFSALQSLLVAVAAERDLSRWKLRLDVGLLAIAYSGLMVMGVAYYLQAWCVEMKGPVFLAAWTPMCFVFTTLCSSFFLGETVRLGSILGGILLVGGLFSVLWGKSNEREGEIGSMTPRGEMDTNKTDVAVCVSDISKINL